MRRASLRVLAVFGIALGVGAAQNASPTAELRIRFGNAAASATANFQSADAIEAKLRQRGSTLHPQIASLRVQIEAALDSAQSALDANDDAGASAAVIRAEALIDRFARRLGK
jgi:ElaB/YqjD/DUF883 family membrane-anchored ribosome-binding protein